MSAPSVREAAARLCEAMLDVSHPEIIESPRAFVGRITPLARALRAALDAYQEDK